MFTKQFQAKGEFAIVFRSFISKYFYVFQIKNNTKGVDKLVAGGL